MPLTTPTGSVALVIQNEVKSAHGLSMQIDSSSFRRCDMDYVGIMMSKLASWHWRTILNALGVLRNCGRSKIIITWYTYTNVLFCMF